MTKTALNQIDMDVALTMTKVPSDDLLARLEQEFTTDEQRMFIRSFRIYANHAPEDLVVGLDDVWKWMGFSKQSNATRLLVKYFSEADGDFKETAAPIGAAVLGAPQNGGQNRRRIVMSIDTFEDFCMRAGTAKAQQVRTYFRKMNRIAMAHIAATSEAARLKELAAQLGIETLKRLESARSNELRVSAHLVEQTRTKPAVYFAIMETLGEDDTVYKVGWSNDINDRRKGLKQTFGSSPIFIDVILTERNEDLEDWILKHPLFLDVKYTNKVNGMHSSIECMRCTLETVTELIKLARKRSVALGTITRMTEAELADKRNEETRLRIEEKREERLMKETIVREERLMKETIVREERLMKETIMREQAASERARAFTTYEEADRALKCDPLNKRLQFERERAFELLNVVVNAVSDAAAGAVAVAAPDPEPVDGNASVDEAGPSEHLDPIPKKVDVRHARAVQIYDPKTLVFVKHYLAMEFAIREVGIDDQGSAPRIKVAADANTEYLGYRWRVVPDGDAVDAPVTIPPTVPHRDGHPGLVAQLTMAKDRVVDVFSTINLAAKAMGLKTPQPISLSINHDKISRGHKWMLWDDVDSALQEKYLETRDLPEVFTRGGHEIQRLDPNTRKVQMTYKSIAKAMSRNNMGRASIVQACLNGTQHGGYGWAMTGGES